MQRSKHGAASESRHKLEAKGTFLQLLEQVAGVQGCGGGWGWWGCPFPLPPRRGASARGGEPPVGHILLLR